MHQEMQWMVQIDEGLGENTTSIDEYAVYLRVVAADKKGKRLIYRLGDRYSAYTSGPSYHSTTCSSRNDLDLREQLKDEVRHKVREKVDTKVKVLQDQLDEVKALLRALAQSTQVSSSATTPHVNDPCHTPTPTSSGCASHPTKTPICYFQRLENPVKRSRIAC